MLRRLLAAFTLACSVAVFAAAPPGAAFEARYDAAMERYDFAEAERVALERFGKLPARPDFTREEHAAAVRMMGDLRARQARYPEAQALLAPLAAWLEAKPRSKSASRAKAHEVLAAYYQDTSRFREAEAHYGRALELLPPSPKPTELELRLRRGQLDLYSNQTRIQEALEAANRLLAAQRASLGANDPAAGVTLTAMAALYSEPHRLERQQEALGAALKLLGPALRGDLPARDDARRNYIYWVDTGGGYSYPEGWQDRCVLRRELVEAVEKRFGSESANLIDPLWQEAAYCEEKLSPATKEAQYKRALAIATKTYGPNHPVTAGVHRHLSTYYGSREGSEGKVPFRGLAEKHFRAAIEGSRATQGVGSPALVLEELLDSIDINHRCDLPAAQCEREMTARFEAVRRDLGAAHPYLGMLMAHAARFQGGSSRSRAEFVDALFRDALTILRGHYGRTHPDVAYHAVRYAEWISGWDRDPKQAVELLAESLATYRKFFGATDSATRNLLLTHAAALTRAGQPALANDQLQLELRALEGNPSENRHQIADLLNYQAEALKAMGRDGEALAARKRSEEIRRR